jgi:hypothetical protein
VGAGLAYMLYQVVWLLIMGTVVTRALRAPSS